MGSKLPANWKQIRIGDIAKPIKRAIPVVADRQYRTMGVKWWGLGAYERETKAGHAISAKKMYSVRPGDWVINKIWVRHGSSGIVGADLDGCVVTADFPTFEVDYEQVTLEWLSYMFKTEWFWTACDTLSRGTSGRQRIDPSDYLTIEIPMPPLDEQRRIVARIEALAGKTDEAAILLSGASRGTEAVVAAESNELFSRVAVTNPSCSIGEVFTYRNELIRPRDGSHGSIRFIGLQHIESHSGGRIGEDWLLAEDLKGRKFKFSPGEILYGYLRPYLNKVWVADCDGICSVDQYVLRPKPNLVDTQYFAHFMRSPVFLKQAIERTHSLQLPRLGTKLLESIPIPLPSMAEQHQIVDRLDRLQSRTDDLRHLQAGMQQEIDALLPSVLDKAFRGEL